ncbi:DUF4157 domain-containing protein [Methylogaea oryzae]|uniref:eCIS core domain-containing protein n=1 Tax=Methylogaea oryzae TaxID=1295382 RepID=A0A8D5AKE5_9GAMM|nr:DUF4157 domain-containing protein [Methylogaea oryzae]BBL71041.1 hypothetical protein MoryE10_16470 [Methylogaea oryzae]
MNTRADKTHNIKNHSIANNTNPTKGGGKAAFQFADNRPEAIAQRKLQEMANNSHQARRAAQLQAMATHHLTQQPIQKMENNTGLPDNLKTGMENLSGMSLDDVKVHRNSDKPAQLQAHAYTQGTDIHLAPGQEKHLPHEAWHVVQQKQGRVKPTLQLKDNVHVNDDAGLEQEADVMGANAMQLKSPPTERTGSLSVQNVPMRLGPLQRKATVYVEEQEKKRVVITAEGKAKDFTGGAPAKNKGWNGVRKYKADAKVGDTVLAMPMTNNNYITGQAGHILAQQNGGDGGDKDNVFAQDGGVNNGPYRKDFENPMRNALDQADDNDKVNFRAVLYGNNIKQGPLNKASDNLEGSDEDTDFEGF